MHCLLHGRFGRCVRCVGPGTCDGSDCHRTEFLGTTQTTEQIQTQSKQSQLGWAAVCENFDIDVEYWMDNWTVSDVTCHAGVIGQYLANAIISDFR